MGVGVCVGQDHYNGKHMCDNSGASHANVQQVATGRKTAMMSVIGCRTSKTDLAGVMESSEGYENIQVFSEIKQ
jgi:hypothetical protein